MIQFLFLLLAMSAVESQNRKNVLMIMVDDLLVPESPIFTPNFDALAQKSISFKKAYCQQAKCSPSRASMITGRRPDTTKVWDMKTFWREAGGNFTTIPQHFKNNGYFTIGIGKIFHQSQQAGGDDDISWSTPFWRSSARDGIWKTLTDGISNLAVNQSMLDLYGDLPDQEILKHAQEELQKIANGTIASGQNFFMAVGFRKPHLPFVYPEEFEDYYESNVILPSNPYAPWTLPQIAWSDFGDLRGRADIEALGNSGAINETFPDNIVLQLRRSYYSSVTFIDDLVGKLLGKLETLGLKNNTIVSLVSDHGYQLGEHAEWTKHTNFERAVRVPFMISVPGQTDNGIETQALVELVDLFPTLVELAGLGQIDKCPENSEHTLVCREGTSLAPLLTDPTQPWKKRAFSQYQRTIINDAGKRIKSMGYTMRTSTSRYTEWVKFKADKTLWDTVYGIELYDHVNDPEENVNLAYEPAYADALATLSAQLREGWRTASPPQDL